MSYQLLVLSFLSFRKNLFHQSSCCELFPFIYHIQRLSTLPMYLWSQSTLYTHGFHTIHRTLCGILIYLLCCRLHCFLLNNIDPVLLYSYWHMRLACMCLLCWILNNEYVEESKILKLDDWFCSSFMVNCVFFGSLSMVYPHSCSLLLVLIGKGGRNWFCDEPSTFV